jgi:hypothetical protein
VFNPAPVETCTSFVQRRFKMLVANRALDVLLVRANRLSDQAKAFATASLDAAQGSDQQIDRP